MCVCVCTSAAYLHFFYKYKEDVSKISYDIIYSVCTVYVNIIYEYVHAFIKALSSVSLFLRRKKEEEDVEEKLE